MNLVSQAAGESRSEIRDALQIVNELGTLFSQSITARSKFASIVASPESELQSSIKFIAYGHSAPHDDWLESNLLMLLCHNLNQCSSVWVTSQLAVLWLPVQLAYYKS